MADIPESLLRRSAEAKAKATGRSVEEVLAEMKGEAPPPPAQPEVPAPDVNQTPEPAQPAVPEPPAGEAEAAEAGTPAAAVITEEAPQAETPTEAPATADEAAADEPAADDESPAADDGGNGANGARRAAMVSARPTAPPADLPEGVRTQRLLTVVKARAIQGAKTEPTDKVSTWPHLMIAEFTALLAMTAFLLILSVILQAPLLEPANFNATPNPSKAPWYFLGLQELLSYFDPQIAGVTVPTIIGLVGFMMIPYVDKNPSNKPSDRKFAIMLYTIFLAGSAVLTIIGVLFRGQGFNFAYPWRDGVFFDDLKDWVHFE